MINYPFRDDAFRKACRYEYGRIESVEKLHLWEAHSLEDLPLFTGIHTLTLYKCTIDAASMHFLGCMTHIKELCITRSTIPDLDALPALQYLEKLELEDVILGTRELSGLPASLKSLRIINCGISDLTPLRAASLQGKLDLRDNQIEDLSPLEQISTLQELLIRNNRVRSLEPLRNLTALSKLNADDNLIESAEPLKALHSLESLWLSGNRIGDISPLSGLSSLTHLGLCGNRIEDISPLCPMTSLISVELSDNRIGDVSPLGMLTGLADLNLKNNRIEDISAFSSLTALETLDLYGNRVRDISALCALPNLYSLNLEGNPIEDVAPLKKLPQFKRREKNWHVSLKLEIPAVKDKSILLKKPFCDLLGMDLFCPEMEPEKVRAERLRKKLPRVKKLCDIHPRAHFCRSAALFRLEDGMGRIALRRYQASKSPDHCDLFFDDQLLVHGDVESGTCSAHLYAGYGNILKDEVYQAVRDRLNADFESIDASMPALAPLLGLFSSGTYMIADFDLFPIQEHYPRPTHFWEAPDYDPYIQFFYGAFSCDISSDAPRYLFPTQPASCMNPAQTDAYIARLQKNDQALRTIAFYLNGSVALVLDGHHKAAAAAALGKPARTLVIFSVEDDKDLLAAVKQGDRIFLHNVSRYLVQGGPMLLCNSHGEHLCSVTSLQSMTRKRLYLPLDAGRKHFNAGMTGKREQWGFIPEEYMKIHESTPEEGDLYSGTAIPPDQIRKIMTAYRTEQPFHLDDRELLSVYGSITIGSTSRCERYHIRHCLLAYHRLFPDSKWLTESDIKFLEDDEKDPYWVPAE